MTQDIVHQATYPYPPADVWRALVNPEAMGAWLMENDFREPVVGHRFAFRDKPKKVVGWDGISRCEVLEVVPERRFVLAFAIEGDASTRVAWELEPTSTGGTRLTLRHSGFVGLKGWLMRAGMNQGWGAIVRHAIPFVVHGMRAGRVPSREETRAMAKKGFRADHVAAKAQA